MLEVTGFPMLCNALPETGSAMQRALMLCFAAEGIIGTSSASGDAFPTRKTSADLLGEPRQGSWAPCLAHAPTQLVGLDLRKIVGLHCTGTRLKPRPQAEPVIQLKSSLQLLPVLIFEMTPQPCIQQTHRLNKPPQNKKLYSPAAPLSTPASRPAPPSPHLHRKVAVHC